MPRASRDANVHTLRLAGKPSRNAASGAAPEEQRVQKISGTSKASATGVMASTGRNKIYAALESTTAVAVLRMAVADLGVSVRGVLIHHNPAQTHRTPLLIMSQGFTRSRRRAAKVQRFARQQSRDSDVGKQTTLNVQRHRIPPGPSSGQSAPVHERSMVMKRLAAVAARR